MKFLTAIFTDAWAFITDPDARKVSIHRFPNGAAMSVREAKMKGLSEA